MITRPDLNNLRPLVSPRTGSERRDPTEPFQGVDIGSVTFDLEELLPAFEQLVGDTLAQIEACPPKSDATFEGYEGLLAAIRSATTLEGVVLERGIELVAMTNPDLVVVPLDRPLPVHEPAKAVFRRNDWSKASSLRLDSEVATREFYKPDILIVDCPRQLALIIDVKRSVSSYKPRTLAELRSRMMASALVVRDVLERDHDAPPVARADIAIIDGAGDCRDEAKGIFALADLDWILRVEGAAEAIARLRALFGTKVRAVLDRRCEAIVGPRLEQRRVAATSRVPHAAGSRSGKGSAEAHPNPDQAVGDEGGNGGAALEAAPVEPDADDNDGELGTDGGSLPPDLLHRAVPAAARAPRPRIRVGIATRGMH